MGLQLAGLTIQTAFLEKNIRLFREVFDGAIQALGPDQVKFSLENAEIIFIQERDPTLTEVTLRLGIDHSLQDFAHRLQFIFYSQFGENYEPIVDLRKNKLTFYDFDGRLWHLQIWAFSNNF